MWKEDVGGQSLWPHGEPLPVPLKPMKGLEDIVKGVLGFVRYYENLCNVDVTEDFLRLYKHIVKYWRGIKVALMEPLPTFDVLRDGFWPTTRVEANRADELNEDG